MIQHTLKAVLFLLFLNVNVTSASVVIKEIMCNPVGSDTEGEWILIENTGDAPISIKGWKFFDGSNHNLVEPPEKGGRGSLTLDSGESAYLANKADTVASLYDGTVIDTVMSLNNKEQIVKLIDAEGNVVSVAEYKNDDGFDEGELCFSAGNTSSSSVDSTLNSTSNQNTSSVSDDEYLKPKNVTFKTVTLKPAPALFLKAKFDEIATLYTPVLFFAEVYDSQGEGVSSNVVWNFGDGAKEEGFKVRHSFLYPGDFMVVAYTSQNNLFAKEVRKIKVISPKLYFEAHKNSLTLHNKSSHDIDISKWTIKHSNGSFVFPEFSLIAKDANSTFTILGFNPEYEWHLETPQKKKYPILEFTTEQATSTSEGIIGKSASSSVASIPAKSEIKIQRQATQYANSSQNLSLQVNQKNKSKIQKKQITYNKPELKQNINSASTVKAIPQRDNKFYLYFALLYILPALAILFAPEKGLADKFNLQD